MVFDLGMTWKGYDDVGADWVSMRLQISRSRDDLKVTRSVISEPTDELSKEDRLVICTSEIVKS